MLCFLRKRCLGRDRIKPVGPYCLRLLKNYFNSYFNGSTLIPGPIEELTQKFFKKSLDEDGFTHLPLQPKQLHFHKAYLCQKKSFQLLLGDYPCLSARNST